MSELALSGAVSVFILVVAVLKRTGLLDQGLEWLWGRIKNRRRPVERVLNPPDIPEIKSISLDVAFLLERHEQEQARLDDEYALIEKFLTRKKEKKHEPV